MNKSIMIGKEADAKKGFLSAHKSDKSIQRIRDESERQLDSLGGVIGNIGRDGTALSAESIATELGSMHIAQRTPALLALQQTHGNRYVQRVVAGIQAKLTVGKPGDKYEQEADRVADDVMRMPEPEVQRQIEPEEEEEEEIQAKPLAEQITPLIQRQVEEEEELIQTKALEQITPLVQRQEEDEEEEEIQTKPLPSQTSEVVSDVETSINSIRGGGQPLPGSTRAFFEPRFGRDFSQVRVHTDTRAAESARALNARAFTVGRDVVFGAGQYTPGASEGRRLMAHELTHVVQQTKASRNFKDDSKSLMRQTAPVSSHEVELGLLKPEDMSVEELANDIVRTEKASLIAWDAALLNFDKVLISSSDKAGNPDFGDVMAKYFSDKAIGKIISTSNAPGVSEIVDLLDKLAEESKRAKAARDSAKLRDFFLDFNTLIAKLSIKLEVNHTDYVGLVTRSYAGMSKEEKSTYKNSLVDHLKDLNNSFETPEQIFSHLSEAWIRSTSTFPHWTVEKPAFVLIRVDRDWTVRNAEIKAPGGGKIAEQLLKYSAGKGVDVWGMQVPRRILYFDTDKTYFRAIVNVDESGNRIVIGSMIEGGSKADEVFQRLEREGLPVTKNLTGD